MNKKKYIIAALIIIFLGLTVFAFANPKFSGSETEDNTKTTTMKKDIKEDDDNVKTSSKTTTKKANNIAYDEALAAVVNAEKLKEDESYEKALNLVKKLSGNSAKDLLDRLEKVNENIVTKLVNDLKKMTNDAENLDELNSARYFRKNQNVVNRVENLVNDELKKVLNDITESLSVLLDDNSVPELNVKDGAVYNTIIKLVAADKNDVVFNLAKNSINNGKILSGYEFKDGKYTIVATDKAYNSYSASFIVDTIYPTITGVSNESYVNGPVQPVILDDNLKSVTLLKNGVKVSDYQDNMGLITDDGSYVIKACDIADNCTTTVFTIDTVTPLFKELTDKSFYNSDVTVDVDEKNIDTIKMYSYKTHKSQDIENGYVINLDGKYKLIATDKAGNKTKITIGIDKINPVFEGIKNGYFYDSDITVNVTDKNLKEITAYSYKTGETNKISNGTVLSDESIYRLIATDKAGNSTQIYVAVDKTAPVFNGIKNGFQYQGGVTVNVEDVKVKKIELYSYTTKQTTDIENGYVLTEDGTYRITATDYVGNSTIVYVEIDNIAPVFNGISNGLFYTTDVTVDVTDKNLKEITAYSYKTGETNKISNGTVLSDESIYRLIATDKAGNSTQIYVAVDKTAPVFNGIKNGFQYQGGVTVNVEDVKVKKIELYSYTTKQTTEIENGYVLTEDGTYRITATDYVGNSTTVYVEIDNIAPVFNGISNGLFYDHDITLDVTDKNLKEITVYSYKTGETNKVANGTVLSADSIYKLIATDKAGNSTQIYAAVDKTAPVFNGISNGITYNGPITVNVDDVKLSKIELFSYSTSQTSEIQNGHILTDAGTYKITATDSFGRSTLIYVAISEN